LGMEIRELWFLIASGRWFGSKGTGESGEGVMILGCEIFVSFLCLGTKRRSLGGGWGVIGREVT
jgi:hypothetical protein